MEVQLQHLIDDGETQMNSDSDDDVDQSDVTMTASEDEEDEFGDIDVDNNDPIRNLRKWMRNSGTTRRNGDTLLKLLSSQFNLKVPSTFYGLMGGNKCEHRIEDITNGRLLHLGIQAGLSQITDPNLMALKELKLDVGIDGFSLFASSKKCLANNWIHTWA